MKTKTFILSVLFLISTSLFAATKENEMAVHLLSYLAQDYGGAVQDGKVISNIEYEEQVDFITEVVRISIANNYDDSLKSQVDSLFKSISNKEEEIKVAEIATTLKANILDKFNLVTYPTSKINLAKAKDLYVAHCLSCHGDAGYGDGEAGVGLDPAPTNFHDLERMQNVSPYGAYNTISLGVNGTGMVAHDYLSEEDRWSLAYFVSAYRFKEVEKNDILNLDINESSALSDNVIKELYNLDDESYMGVLASVRDPNSNPPGDGNKGQLSLHLSKAINDLKKSFLSYEAGDFNEAKNLSFSSYLKGVEPIEGMLRSTDEKVVLRLEADFLAYRSLLTKKAPSTEVALVLEKLIGQLEELKTTSLIEKTHTTSMLLSFGIVLRETFEAGLILFLLFGLTKKSNATTFNKNIHAGWISSLVIGIVLFIILESFFTISGKVAEVIAGYTAIFAAVMLFYVGYWLHKSTDIQKMKNLLTGAVESSVGSGKGLALFFIAFSACFREMFEIILFLKIIILDGHQVLYVAVGAVLALVLAVATIWIAVKYSIKLNLKYLFKASTALILSFSIIFLGKGIGALQKTGILEQTRIDIYSFPSIGFNSTLEVLIAQASVVIVIALFTFASFKQKQLVKVNH